MFISTSVPPIQLVDTCNCVCTKCQCEKCNNCKGGDPSLHETITGSAILNEVALPDEPIHVNVSVMLSLEQLTEVINVLRH